jgi:hypothetical protein
VLKYFLNFFDEYSTYKYIKIHQKMSRKRFEHFLGIFLRIFDEQRRKKQEMV